MGVEPGYEQKTFAESTKRGQLRLVASHDGAGDSVRINADAAMYAGLFDGDESASLVLKPTRKAYVHLIRGQLRANGQDLKGGDALMLEGEKQLQLSDGQDAEVLVFDLAA